MEKLVSEGLAKPKLYGYFIWGSRFKCVRKVKQSHIMTASYMAT